MTALPPRRRYSPGIACRGGQFSSKPVHGFFSPGLSPLPLPLTGRSPVKLSPAVTELYPDAASVFKDTYLVEFLDLRAGHAEADLQRALVEQLKIHSWRSTGSHDCRPSKSTYGSRSACGGNLEFLSRTRSSQGAVVNPTFSHDDQLRFLTTPAPEDEEQETPAKHRQGAFTPAWMRGNVEAVWSEHPLATACGSGGSWRQSGERASFAGTAPHE